MPKLEPLLGESRDEWKEYVEVLEQYLIANDITEAKKRAVFLSNCGKRAYSLPRNLLAPKRPRALRLHEAQYVNMGCFTLPGSHCAVTQEFSIGEKPIAFASRRLMAAEQNYSHLDKEAFALVFGITKVHQYLWGRHFEVFTDLKPLLGLLGADKRIPPQCSPRTQS